MIQKKNNRPSKALKLIRAISAISVFPFYRVQQKRPIFRPMLLLIISVISAISVFPFYRVQQKSPDLPIRAPFINSCN